MIHSKEKKKSELTFSIILTILLIGFVGLIFYVNLSCNPSYYDADIYADIDFAKQAWRAKSLFPQNWVFGNQTYVVATPVLAAVIYGAINNAVLAMGIASCVMTALIMLTYDWMMRPVFSYNERMTGFLFMAGLILIKDHIATGIRGAQLFFTMASYYSCYIITAFIVYGCYIRIRQEKFLRKHIPMLIIAVALSFATGIQSLRQMAVMVLPLVACEILEIIIDSVRRKRLSFSLSSGFTLAIFIFNLLGIFVMKRIHIEQTSIFGETKISFPHGVKELISEVVTSLLNDVISIFQGPDNPYMLNLILPSISLLIILVAFVINLVKQIKEKKTEKYELTLNLALILGCASVFAISILTSLNSRNIYYFMIFPLLALSIASIVKAFKRVGFAAEYVIAVMVLSVLVYRGVGTVNEIKKGTDRDSEAYQIADYIKENGYDTLYYLSGFNWRYYPTGEDVIVASGDSIYPIRMKSVCYWEETPIPEYLRVKDNYKTRSDEKSIYLFNEKDLKEAKVYCEKHGIEIREVAQIGERYLCRLSVNLLAFSEEKGK